MIEEPRGQKKLIKNFHQKNLTRNRNFDKFSTPCTLRSIFWGGFSNWCSTKLGSPPIRGQMQSTNLKTRLSHWVGWSSLSHRSLKNFINTVPFLRFIKYLYSLNFIMMNIFWFKINSFDQPARASKCYSIHHVIFERDFWKKFKISSKFQNSSL